MRQLMIRFLSFSLFFFLLTGCDSLPRLANSHAVSLKNEAYVYNPLFLKENQALIFKMNVSIYKHKMSGTFVHKKINDTLHRVALLSEFGKTLLDISYARKYSQINYIMPALDRKIIIRTLLSDFRFLTKTKRPVLEKSENKTESMLKSQNSNGFVYYFFEKKTQHLTKLVKTNKRKPQVVIYFTNFKNHIPNTIKLLHNGIDLSIILTAIPQTYAN